MRFGRRLLAVAAAALVLPSVLATSRASGPKLAPEFPTLEPAHWIGAPVRMADLRGRVVLLDVWTFG